MIKERVGRSILMGAADVIIKKLFGYDVSSLLIESTEVDPAVTFTNVKRLCDIDRYVLGSNNFFLCNFSIEKLSGNDGSALLVQNFSQETKTVRCNIRCG